MGTEMLGFKLLYVFSFFFCGDGRGLGIASPGVHSVQVLERRNMAEFKGGGTHLFNVRSFGAQADGYTDDRRVSSSSPSSYFVMLQL